jgi:hypothetical protein
LATVGLGATSDFADAIFHLNDAVGAIEFKNSLNSLLQQMSASNTYAGLTDSSLKNYASWLTASGVIQSADTTPLFTITPSQTKVYENGGATLNFTITRSSALQDQTVFVSTLMNGYDNSGNYYYTGLNSVPVKFKGGALTASVTLTVNDPGLTAGSETFSLIVQRQQSDLPTTYAAKADFTIIDNDQLPAVNYSISPSTPSVNETAGTQTFTITRDDASRVSTVYVSTVHDLGTNNKDPIGQSGNYYYNGIVDQAVTFGVGQKNCTGHAHRQQSATDLWQRGISSDRPATRI